eukprot:c27894_g3_i1 orf=21-179(-)
MFFLPSLFKELFSQYLTIVPMQSRRNESHQILYKKIQSFHQSSVGTEVHQTT